MLNRILNFEKLTDYKNAYYELLKIRDSVEYESMAGIININIKRIVKKIENMASFYMKNIQIIKLYQNNNNPYSYIYKNNKFKPIISMTTISGRIKNIIPTLESIVNQSSNIHSVNLYISDEKYLLDNGIERNNNILKDIYKLGVNIYYTYNIGPYRKIIPILSQLWLNNASSESLIITVDDDVIYDNDFVENLVNNIRIYDCVVGYRGRKIINNELLSPYNKWTKGDFKPELDNVLTGRGGIIYKLKFFSKNYKYYVGQILAPTADDIWCKFMTLIYCIPSFIINIESAFDKNQDFKDNSGCDKSCSLFYKYNSGKYNDMSIYVLNEYYKNYGIDIRKIIKEA